MNKLLIHLLKGNKKLKLLISIIILILVFINSFPLENNTERNPKKEDTTQTQNEYYRVEKVIDGDTIDVLINEEKQRIRLIGLNTPETVDPRKPIECFGKEASNYAKTILENQEIKLESDPTQNDKDRYSRLLRYIFLKDGTNFAEKMIAEGYAYEYTYDKPYKYQIQFKKAQQIAQQNKLGLWREGACEK